MYIYTYTHIHRYIPTFAVIRFLKVQCMLNFAVVRFECLVNYTVLI